MPINVIKRNGSKEELNLDKLHKVVEWACEGVSGVSVSEIELKSQIQFYNNIKTKAIHETMIRAAADLITEDTPNYQYVAGRLVNYQLRKEVYGQYEPINLLDHYMNKVDDYYDPSLQLKYFVDEWDQLSNYIDHDRDFNIVYVGIEQMRGKYLIKDRVTGQIFETPQMAFMLISMSMFADKPRSERMKWVKDFYDALSNFEISLPTPIMAGVRTTERQYSSCTLIESDDSLDSIIATSGAIVKYVANRAGIGLAGGGLRAYNSPIRGGKAKHTGLFSFWRLWQNSVKSCSQGALRDGSATIFCPIWHKEIEDLLVLKNNKGTPETRLKDMDYGFQFNKVMYERLISEGNITLFSPSDVPGLYEAFFNDTDKFRELYEKYEADKKITNKKVISAVELFSLFMTERKDTGRVYLMNVDHCNDHGSFKKDRAAIRMSNLCMEITLPTKPLKHLFDTEGEISLCTLAAINQGKIKKPADYERLCTLLVHALNSLLDNQKYPVIAAEISTKNRRPLGIGLINLAYWLAKNGTSYQNPDLDLIHEYMEAFSYYLIKASVDLAKEKGPCPKSEDTLYSEGIFPIDTYKKEVDELVNPVYRMDWETLRKDAIEFGIYNSTLMAQFPAETSAQVSNATNGIEPPRSLVSVKLSKDGALRQVVPEIHKLKNKYDLLWDQKSPLGYLSIIAVMQKFFDQSISTNTSYNPKFYPENELSMLELLGHLVWVYKYGIKTLYYCNIADGSGDEIEIDDANCDSCTV